MNEDKEKTPHGHEIKAIVEESAVAEARAKAVTQATATLDRAARAVAEAVNRAVAADQVDAGAWKAVQEGAWPAELARAVAVARAEEWKAVAEDATRSARRMAEGVDETEARVAAAVNQAAEAVEQVAQVLATVATRAERAARKGAEHRTYVVAQAGKAEARSRAWTVVAENAQDVKMRMNLANQAAMDWANAWAAVAMKTRSNDVWVAEALAAAVARTSVEIRLNELATVAEKTVKAIAQTVPY